MNLALSLLALAFGPLLYGLFRRAETVRSTLDGFLFVTIAGIVVVHIVPDVFAIAGLTAIVFLALGVSFALAVERYPATQTTQGYSWIVMIGALGLVIHAAMDGIALLPGDHLHGADGDHLHGLGSDHQHGSGAGHLHSVLPDHQHADAHAEEELSPGGFAGLLNNHLALGVILHRIPVGMAIWWTLRPQVGSPIAVATLALIAGSTTGAYLFGEPILDLMQTGSVACFQAFVAGTLLHVIVVSTARHRAGRAGDSTHYSQIGERLGVIAGLFLVYLVPHAH